MDQSDQKLTIITNIGVNKSAMSSPHATTPIKRKRVCTQKHALKYVPQVKEGGFMLPGKKEGKKGCCGAVMGLKTDTGKIQSYYLFWKGFSHPRKKIGCQNTTYKDKSHTPG